MGAHLGRRRLHEPRVRGAPVGPELTPAKTAEQQIGRRVVGLGPAEKARRGDRPGGGVVPVGDFRGERRGGHEGLRCGCGLPAGAVRLPRYPGWRGEVWRVRLDLEFLVEELAHDTLHLAQRLPQPPEVRRAVPEFLPPEAVQCFERGQAAIELHRQRLVPALRG